MASTDSWSSCAPQANCHPPPPMAHAPTPMGVISRSLAPSLFFCIPLSCQEHLSLVSLVFHVFLVSLVFLLFVTQALAPSAPGPAYRSRMPRIACVKAPMSVGF